MALNKYRFAVFLYLQFRGFLHSVENNNGIFGILRKFRVKSICICFYYEKISKISPYLTGPSPDPRQKYNWVVSLDQMAVIFDIYVKNAPENMSYTSCLLLLFLVKFCDVVSTLYDVTYGVGRSFY